MFFKRLSEHPRFEHTPPCVWVNQAAKWRGLTSAATLALAADKWVVVVAHFAQTLTEAYTALAQAQLPCEVFEAPPDQARLRAGLNAKHTGQLWLCLADVLVNATLAPMAEGTLTTNLNTVVLGAELHFLAASDTAVATWAKAVPGSVQFTFHAALDDPLLQYFGGSMLQGLVQQLQLAPTEPINSNLVARSLEAAQQRMARMAHSQYPARSATEWMQRNLPPKM